MSRLIWWLIIGLGAWWLIKRLRVGRAGGGAEQAAPQPGASTTHDPLVMARCAHCGMHLPQPEALLDDAQRSYCSAAHRVAGPR